MGLATGKKIGPAGLKSRLCCCDRGLHDAMTGLDEGLRCLTATVQQMNEESWQISAAILALAITVHLLRR